MPETLRHGKKPRTTSRNGNFIGGYLQDTVAAYVRELAAAEQKTVSNFLNAHFLRLKNGSNTNKSSELKRD